MTRTGLRLLWIISTECRYSKPLAASASFTGILIFEDWGGNKDQAYEAKAVSLGVLRCEVHDVSVNHPFTDDAQWEQLRGDTQHRQDIWVGETPPDHNFLEQTLPRVVKGARHA